MKKSEPDWYGLMKAIIAFAITSPDTSTQNAAMLVTPDGEGIGVTVESNRFPNGVQGTLARLERPLKYECIEHAERNTIYAAARCGIRTEGLTMVCVWAACADCARAIIQAGIVRLVRYVSDAHLHWGDSISTADTLLQEAGVEVITLTEPIEGCRAILRNGKEWFPNGIPQVAPLVPAGHIPIR